MELEYLVNVCVIDNLIERAHSKQGLQTVHTNLCTYKEAQCACVSRIHDPLHARQAFRS